jgi:hypothetical protein
MVDDFISFFVGGIILTLKYRLYVFFYNQGQETIAALLSSLFLELGRNKDVLKK